ncbi:hypothetical protein MMC25_004738 [Agyrium rufum]|nr:hypothetical protein [Agyrium rufum]
MADDNSDEVPLSFHIKSSADAKYDITMPSTTTVLDLKVKLAGAEYADIPPERQRLIYSGRVLKDPDTLESYKIKSGHTIHLVKGAASNQRQNPANQGSTTSSASGASNAPTPASGVPSNLATGTGNNPLAGLTGARYAGFAQLPNQSMFGPDGGMGPPPDPEQFINMMQNPQVASTINEALQNPQLIDMMIQQNPMLRDVPNVRQMLQSPEFRRMMTDPEQLRNISNMQRMFGGGMPGMMGGGGNNGFPMPGVTDNTTGGQNNASTGPGQQGGQQAQMPQMPMYNPFAMFGNPNAGAAGAGGSPANPFASMFQPPPAGNTPSQTPPVIGSAGQNTPSAAPTTPGTTNNPTDPQTNPQQQQPPNPFMNPMFQNPAMMQNFLAAMNPQNQQPGAGGQSPPSNPNAAANPLAALFGPGGGMGGMGGIPPWMQGAAGGGQTEAQDSRPPEERYEEQLRQLNEMGFYEFDRNVEALRRMGGSVQGAIEWLLRG